MTAPVLASGEQVELTSGRLRLTIVTVGGGLRELTCEAGRCSTATALTRSIGRALAAAHPWP